MDQTELSTQQQPASQARPALPGQLATVSDSSPSQQQQTDNESVTFTTMTAYSNDSSYDNDDNVNISDSTTDMNAALVTQIDAAVDTAAAAAAAHDSTAAAAAAVNEAAVGPHDSTAADAATYEIHTDSDTHDATSAGHAMEREPSLSLHTPHGPQQGGLATDSSSSAHVAAAAAAAAAAAGAFEAEVVAAAAAAGWSAASARASESGSAAAAAAAGSSVGTGRPVAFQPSLAGWLGPGDAHTGQASVRTSADIPTGVQVSAAVPETAEDPGPAQYESEPDSAAIEAAPQPQDHADSSNADTQLVSALVAELIARVVRDGSSGEADDSNVSGLGEAHTEGEVHSSEAGALPLSQGPSAQLDTHQPLPDLTSDTPTLASHTSESDTQASELTATGADAQPGEHTATDAQPSEHTHIGEGTQSEDDSVGSDTDRVVAGLVCEEIETCEGGVTSREVVVESLSVWSDTHTTHTTHTHTTDTTVAAECMTGCSDSGQVADGGSSEGLEGAVQGQPVQLQPEQLEQLQQRLAPLEDALRVLRRLGERRTYQQWRTDLRAWEEQYGAVAPHILADAAADGAAAPRAAAAAARVYVPPDPAIAPLPAPADDTGPSMLGDEVPWTPPPLPTSTSTASTAGGVHTPAASAAYAPELMSWPSRGAAAAAATDAASQAAGLQSSVAGAAVAAVTQPRTPLGRVLNAAMAAVEEATATAAAVVAALALADELSASTAALVVDAGGRPLLPRASHSSTRSSNSGLDPVDHTAGDSQPSTSGVVGEDNSGAAALVMGLPSSTSAALWLTQARLQTRAVLSQLSASENSRAAAASAAAAAAAAATAQQQPAAAATQLPGTPAQSQTVTIQPPTTISSIRTLDTIRSDLTVLTCGCGDCGQERADGDVCLQLTVVPDATDSELETVSVSLSVVGTVRCQLTVVEGPVEVVDDLFGVLTPPGVTKRSNGHVTRTASGRILPSVQPYGGVAHAAALADPEETLADVFSASPSPSPAHTGPPARPGPRGRRPHGAPSPPPPAVPEPPRDPFGALDLAQLAAAIAADASGAAAGGGDAARSDATEPAPTQMSVEEIQQLLQEMMFVDLYAEGRRRLLSGGGGVNGQSTGGENGRPLGMVAAHEQEVLRRHFEWVARYVELTRIHTRTHTGAQRQLHDSASVQAA